MRRALAIPAGLVLVGLTIVATASPAWAHGVGGRTSLPLETWQFAYAAGATVAISFAALRLLWPTARLDAAARNLRPFPAPVADGLRWIGLVGRAAMLVLLGVCIVASYLGPDNPTLTITPVAVYVVFWVVMQAVAAIFGPVWDAVNPLDTLAAIGQAVRRRPLDPTVNRATGIWATRYPAAVGLFSFLWLELAFFRPDSITAVSRWLTAYVVIHLALAVRFGRGWLRESEGFSVLFAHLALLSPIGRDGEGRLGWRRPLTGLALESAPTGTVAVIGVVLGGTAFDGVARTLWWREVLGTRQEWSRTLVQTIGLGLTMATVAVVFLVAVRFVDRLAGDDESPEHVARWAPSLIPIVLAYAVAHYFTLAVDQVQVFVALLSDPWNEGWDLFGTAGNAIDYGLVTANQTAWIQILAIVVGHVIGIVAAHDRAIELYGHRKGVVSQYPLLAVMVLYTVGGLFLLLNA